MMRFLTLPLIMLLHYNVIAQSNCNAFLIKGDSCQYKACKYIEDSPEYFQLTKEFHQVYEKAITICPEYSQAYRAKSTAYLKTGDFITWKKLMDQAVSLNAEQHLSYRGWCRFQFFRDYEGAIKDIERLEKLVHYDIGFSQNGDYHLKVVKALCYKMIGKTKKAIKLIEEHILEDKQDFELYNNLHLGVLYLEEKRFTEAIQAFDRQSKINELAENQYYKAMAQRALNDLSESVESLNKAKDLYLNSRFMYDTYTYQVDKVFLKEIEIALKTKD